MSEEKDIRDRTAQSELAEDVARLRLAQKRLSQVLASRRVVKVRLCAVVCAYERERARK